jgi:hypothetical protein
LAFRKKIDHGYRRGNINHADCITPSQMVEEMERKKEKKVVHSLHIGMGWLATCSCGKWCSETTRDICKIRREFKKHKLGMK